MFGNYLKIALRNINKQKIYSFINIVGLSVGITAAILIILFVSDENNYDKFNHNYDRIARVITTSKTNEIHKYSLSSAYLGKRLESEYPEIQNSVAMLDRYSFGRFTIEYNHNRYYESEYLVTQPSFLKMFDFKVLQASKNNLLAEPNEMVLTEATAKKLFGDENPIGKVIKTDRRWGSFKVTGIVQNPPKNSHIQFSILISFKSLQHFNGFYKALEDPDFTPVRTYLLFKNPANIKNFNKKLLTYEKNHKGSKEFGITDHISLQPMSDIHYGSQNIEYDYVNYASRDKTTIYILEILGLLIIIIAGINYTNLASARSISRAKEIGIRKVVGAVRRQLVSQLLVEAVFLSVISLLIAFILVEILLPSFNSFTDKNISLIKHFNIVEISAILFVTLLVGLISGSLPALFLSKLKPVLILKNRAQPKSALTKIGKGLVITQFAISSVLVLATISFYQQLQFVRNKDLGFNKNHLLVVDINSSGSRNNSQAIKSEVLKSPDIKSISVSTRLPGDWKNIGRVFVRNTNETEKDKRKMKYIGIDKDFLKTFQMHLISGRNFLGNPVADSIGIIINQAAVKALGLSQPLGQFINLSDNNSSGKYKIIGVVKNFNFRSLHEKISPIILGYWNNRFENIDYYTARISGTNIQKTIKYFSEVQQKFDNVTPFEYNFLDERLNDFYIQDEREATIINYASGFALFVACFGLFGLTAFSAKQRTKEIGIRKVLGANVPSLLKLLSKNFLMLVLIANMVSWPFAYYFINKWLSNFAYRIDIGVSVFLLTTIGSILVAFLTMIYQVLKVTSSNPVEALKYE